MKNELIEKLTAYFKTKSEIIAVYLFGSYAEGREGDTSDIDIGILFDIADPVMAKKKTDNLMVELSRILRKDIHPVILNLAGEEILRQIFLKGKCILVNNKKKLVRYKMTTFARIADFAYYKKRMQSGLIRNVMEG
ncbi:MAG: nucleotidyltransferase domain-containing protein [Desulfobacterales bacterium]|jgi:predicted nucleotidyltransferase